MRLFLNNGNGTFTDVTADSGLKNPGWGCSAAFLDYDRDGWLDLVIANYVAYDPTKKCLSENELPDYCGPNKFPGPNRLTPTDLPIPASRAYASTLAT
jgi:hypothetical protein